MSLLSPAACSLSLAAPLGGAHDEAMPTGQLLHNNQQAKAGLQRAARTNERAQLEQRCARSEPRTHTRARCGGRAGKRRNSAYFGAALAYCGALRARARPRRAQARNVSRMLAGLIAATRAGPQPLRVR